MLAQLCANSDLIVGFGVIVVAIAVLWTETNLGWQLSQAEKYVDPTQGSGNSGKFGLTGHLQRGVRANTGLGYTMAGQAAWWRGFRCSLVGLALIAGLFLAGELLSRFCS